MATSQIIVQWPRCSRFKFMQCYGKASLFNQSNYLRRDCRFGAINHCRLCVNLVKSVFFDHAKKNLAAVSPKIPKELSCSGHENGLGALRVTRSTRERVIERTRDTTRSGPSRALGDRGSFTSPLCGEQVFHCLQHLIWGAGDSSRVPVNFNLQRSRAIDDNGGNIVKLHLKIVRLVDGILICDDAKRHIGLVSEHFFRIVRAELNVCYSFQSFQ